VISILGSCLSGLNLPKRVSRNFTVAQRVIGQVTGNPCELNRWMQHHLTEIICFRGGVYESRKTVWSFFGPEDRELAAR
jgi:hypothetical protein